MGKRIAILGSTGSIGTSALEVVSALGSGYEVVALSARENIELLERQCRQFRPAVAAVANPHKARAFQTAMKDFAGRILSGPEGLVEIASLAEVDIVLTAVVGAAGLPAVLAAARCGKTLAIANKEPLVVAGKLLTETARAGGATILPVDSEHSAIFQALQAGRHEEIGRIILTASGGPFRGATAEQIREVTVEQALNHPTWNMGPKITIDCATMMNKALEIIEAVWLFDVPVDKIAVLVHPESIVHSMVEFIDGSIVAQLGAPDMKLPIQYALTWPNRCRGAGTRLRLEELGRLSFEPPDRRVFRSLDLAYEAARRGGSAPVVFNAANEVAVEEFLAGRIRFPMITELVEDCLNKLPGGEAATLDEILEVDRQARRVARETIRQTA
jgi:1-deoxy-D-xylulose-5-phosphate reductoisomerase